MDSQRFPKIGQSLIYFLRASMGEYDYDDFTSEAFLMIFLFLNLVIMLNLIVAIMVSTYQKFESNSHGYFYTMILGIIPSLEFNESYGAIFCATQPLDLLFLFVALPFFVVPDKRKPTYNRIASTVLYLPIAFGLTLFFVVTNTLLFPIAYFTHIGRILWSVPF